MSALYRPGPGAVDPPGIGEGASLDEPCVFGGFLLADAPAGDADGLLIAAVLLGCVVPESWHAAKNAMPIETTIRANVCFFIGYPLYARRRVSGRFK
jgi:hypothetical protein